MASSTIVGGLVPFNFLGPNTAYDNLSQLSFGNFFGYGNLIGHDTVVFDGTGAPPSPALSANQTLAVTAPSDFTVPGGFKALYDINGDSTIDGGSSSLNVFLSGDPAQFATGSGNDTVFAGGADTISAGSGSNTVLGSANGVTVQGGSGSLYFLGAAGSVSVMGGSGDTTMFGGTGSALTYLVGGSGNNTLVGGTGGGITLLMGGNNAAEFAAGSGPTTMIAGTGTSILNGTTGTGVEIAMTNGGTALIALNDAADSVLAGAGAATILGGNGNDVFGFLQGYAGGTATIAGFHAGDQVALNGYGDNGVTSEQVLNGSDIITLSDGTTITLSGYDHKLFS